MADVFIQTLIDVDSWNAAGWLGTAFLHDESGREMPRLGIVFTDIRAGNRIFSGWRERLGAVDEFEELRISIIEGDIVGEDPGYTIHISSNPLNTARRLGSKVEAPKMIIVSRMHRMTPQPGSPHLGRFKKEFAKHKRYQVIPISAEIQPNFALSIEKTEVHFRQACDIGRTDLDAVIFPEHYFDLDDIVQ